jgi:hypothetical protein
LLITFGGLLFCGQSIVAVKLLRSRIDHAVRLLKLGQTIDPRSQHQLIHPQLVISTGNINWQSPIQSSIFLILNIFNLQYFMLRVIAEFDQTQAIMA